MNFFDKVNEIFISIKFQNDLLIQEGMAQEEEKTRKLQEVIKICHSVKLSRAHFNAVIEDLVSPL